MEDGQDIEVDIGQARTWVRQGIGQIIDVRFPEEQEIFGPIGGAKCLPLSFLQRFCGHTPDPHCEEFSVCDLMAKERTDLTRALVCYADQQKSVLCLCRSGNRSLVAARLLRALGFVRAYSVQGGTEAWQDAALLPDIKSSSSPGDKVVA
ncbi:MAG: rhodanese-like domain-containing protein [Betaproteobacteria bacterium]|nr:rhodanese-like domain-containing protein [Betaproteobacteria bacterium]